MTPSGIVRVLCSLTRSAFSGERIYRVQQTNGETYVGAAAVQDCYHSDGTPLRPEEPAPGQKIEGTVEGFLVTNGGGVAQIAMPDGETIRVATHLVLRPKEVSPSYVPL